MVFIGTSGILGRFVPLDASVAVWWRAAIALVLLGIYGWWRGADFQLRGRRQTIVVLLSGVLMAGHWLTYFEALQRSSVAIGMLSIFTFPAMTTLLEPLLLGKPFEVRHLLLAAMVMVGIYFLAPSFDLNNGATVGLLFGLLSALIYSLRNLLMKTQVDSVDGSVLMTYQAGVATILVIPFLFGQQAMPGPDAWPYLIGLGLLTTAIGHTLFLGTFKHFSVSTVSILSCIQPIYGILLGVVLFGEIPPWSSVVGGVLILAAVAVEAWFTTQRSAPDNSPKAVERS